MVRSPSGLEPIIDAVNHANQGKASEGSIWGAEFTCVNTYLHKIAQGVLIMTQITDHLFLLVDGQGAQVTQGGGNPEASLPAKDDVLA